MKSDEVVRWPEDGQFWVWLNPLALIRLDVVGTVITGTPGCFNATRWTPIAEEPMVFYELSSPVARFLWWEKHLNINQAEIRKRSLLPGDVLIHDNNLLFIGPETKDSSIHVLATWEVPEAALKAPVYQYGPGHLANRKTSYEHLLYDDEP